MVRARGGSRPIGRTRADIGCADRWEPGTLPDAAEDAIRRVPTLVTSPLIGSADPETRRDDPSRRPARQCSPAIADWTLDSPTSDAITTWITAPSAEGHTTIAWCESPFRRLIR
jgi:hypothetical protein